MAMIAKNAEALVEMKILGQVKRLESFIEALEGLKEPNSTYQCAEIGCGHTGSDPKKFGVLRLGGIEVIIVCNETARVIDETSRARGALMHLDAYIADELETDIERLEGKRAMRMKELAKLEKELAKPTIAHVPREELVQNADTGRPRRKTCKKKRHNGRDEEFANESLADA